MDTINAIFYIAVLIMSVVIHEVSHGFMAEFWGDPTARRAGRLTLNPLPHLDLVGSILIPALLIFSKAGFLFGWAKPVPYDPRNLRDERWGTLAVAAAGILANLFMAVFFGLLLRFTANSNFPMGFYVITSSIVLVNLALAIFNLVPIPPLDGSKILLSFLPRSLWPKFFALEQFSFILLIIFIVYFSDILYPILGFMYHLITGLYLG